MGIVVTGKPPGESFGQFTNSDAPLYLIITTSDEDVTQSAFFPEP